MKNSDTTMNNAEKMKKTMKDNEKYRKNKGGKMKKQ